MGALEAGCGYLVYPGRGKDPGYTKIWIRWGGFRSRNEALVVPQQNGLFEVGREHVLAEHG